MTTGPVKAFLIYQGISNRGTLENSPCELPSQGLLFVDESDVRLLFGEHYRGQVIRDWRYTFERQIKNDPRYQEFFRYALTLDRPLLRLKKC